MKINSFNASSFRLNPSKKQSFKAITFDSDFDKYSLSKKSAEKNLFFVDMFAYGKNDQWASKMLRLRNELSDFMVNKADFDVLLEIIETKLPEVGKGNVSRHSWGQKRCSQTEFYLFKHDRGREYFNKYQRKCKLNKIFKKQDSFSPTATKKYQDAQTVELIDKKDGIIIRHAECKDGIYKNLDYAKQEYDKLQSMKNPSLAQINKSIATIHWLFAQANPYCRGSDSAAVLLSKALYKAHGVQVFQLKRSRSFDFEAFYSDLKSYVRKYPKLFKYKPQKFSG